MYNALNWYWLIGSQIYGSKINDFLHNQDAEFTDWLSAGNMPTRIGSEDELIDVLLPYGIVPPFCTKERQRAWALAQLPASMHILFEHGA